MYAINLNEDKRILRATFEQFADNESILVSELPEGDIAEYLYVDGEYIHKPLPQPEQPEPTLTFEEQLEKTRADIDYISMMTGIEIPTEVA